MMRRSRRAPAREPRGLRDHTKYRWLYFFRPHLSKLDYP